MSLVKDWVGDFLARHRARFSPHDWPSGGEEYRAFVMGWISALSRAEASEAEAEGASLRLADRPPSWLRDHIPAVLDQIRKIREERGAPALTREDARDRSLSCEYCCGQGMVSVYHPHPDYAARIPASVAAHCTCPHGRWIRKRLDEDSETRHLNRRIPDLAEVLDGRSTWLLDPPGIPPAGQHAPGGSQKAHHGLRVIGNV